MSLLDLLGRLRAADIRLHLDAGKLKVSAPKGGVAPELLVAG